METEMNNINSDVKSQQTNEEIFTKAFKTAIKEILINNLRQYNLKETKLSDLGRHNDCFRCVVSGFPKNIMEEIGNIVFPGETDRSRSYFIARQGQGVEGRIRFTLFDCFDVVFDINRSLRENIRGMRFDALISPLDLETVKAILEKNNLGTVFYSIISQ